MWIFVLQTYKDLGQGILAQFDQQNHNDACMQLANSATIAEIDTCKYLKKMCLCFLLLNSGRYFWEDTLVGKEELWILKGLWGKI